MGLYLPKIKTDLKIDSHKKRNFLVSQIYEYSG